MTHDQLQKEFERDFGLVTKVPNNHIHFDAMLDDVQYFRTRAKLEQNEHGERVRDAVAKARYAKQLRAIARNKGVTHDDIH